MKQLLAIVVLTIVSIVWTVKCAEPSTDCDTKKPPPVLDGASGQLRITNPQKLENKICEWVIQIPTVNVTTNSQILLVIDEPLLIGAKDSLKVLSNDTKTTLYESEGFLWPGVILFDKPKPKDNPIVRVVLTLSNETLDRRWNGNVQYNTNLMAAQVSNIDSTGRFVFAYNSNTTDLTNSFTVTLKTKNKSKRLLLNADWLNLGGKDGSVVFSNVTQNINEKTFKDKEKPDFVLSAEQQIKIDIKDFKTKNNSNGIQFSYELVDSLCSQYKVLKDLDKAKDMENIKLPDQTALQTLSSFKCLNIFEHQNQSARLLFDLSDYEFLNTGDMITVLDGNSRDSKTLAVIESQFLNNYWKQLYLYSTSNKMWIFFDSPQVINRVTNRTLNVIGVRAQSQGGSCILNAMNNQTVLEINTKTSPELPVVYTFEADSDQQIVIDFKDGAKLPGNGTDLLMTISDNNGRTVQPFIGLYSNHFPPDIMASNTNQMRIEFNQTVDFKAQINYVKKGCHSAAVGDSSAYIMKGCNELCSWLIPQREKSTGTFILQFTHLDLPEKSDNILIEQLGPTTSGVLNISGTLSSLTFPDVILDSSNTYILYTKRKCSKGSIDGSQLLGVSLIYDDKDISTHTYTLTKDVIQPIMTSSYPNYYSIGRDHLWKIDGTVNQTKMALISFNDLDLIPSHQLLLKSPNNSVDLTSADQLAEISDYLLPFPILLNLTSQTIDSSKQPFSARGFKATVRAVSCGDAIKVEPKKTITISTPKSLDGISKCIWTVTTDNANKSVINLLEFDLSNGKDFDPKNLRIYDSNSIRDNKELDLKYFNSHKMSSTNALIIDYTIDSKKKEVELTFTFNQTVCHQLCDNKKRCLLPEFYCNGVNDCGDFSDEMGCNGTHIPTTTPPPQPGPDIHTTSGINGWVVFLVLCPLSIGIGVLSTLYGPLLLRRVGRGRYREFQDFSEVS